MRTTVCDSLCWAGLTSKIQPRSFPEAGARDATLNPPKSPDTASEAKRRCRAEGTDGDASALQRGRTPAHRLLLQGISSRPAHLNLISVLKIHFVQLLPPPAMSLPGPSAVEARVRPAKIPSVDGVLPMELLFEVLLLLPAKEVCRVRAVCPSWRSLTYDPIFIAAHAAPARSSPCSAVGGATPALISWTCPAMWSNGFAPQPLPGAMSTGDGCSARTSTMSFSAEITTASVFSSRSLVLSSQYHRALERMLQGLMAPAIQPGLQWGRYLPQDATNCFGLLRT
jgi:hypothetical protein